MSSTLLFLVPIGMLAVVWSLCFVGCPDAVPVLPPSYSSIILAEPSLLAYWPLSDAPPLGQGDELNATTTVTVTATDLSGTGHNGTYTIPPQYPTTLPAGQPPEAAIAAPFVNLRQPSLVPGDIGSGDKNTSPASVDFEGGYVRIPWNTANSTPPSLPQFTVEAWIQPHWTGTPNVLLVLFGALTDTTGFAVYINQQNFLGVTIGNGTALKMFDSTVLIDPTNVTYVAVTGDTSTGNVTFFANAQDGTAMTQTIPGTGYAAVSQSQMVTFFIGAGDNQDSSNLRTQPMGTGAPEYPFQGQIQSVALYNSALSSTTDLPSHFSNGSAG
jgi:hypothetical protein